MMYSTCTCIICWPRFASLEPTALLLLLLGLVGDGTHGLATGKTTGTASRNETDLLICVAHDRQAADRGARGGGRKTTCEGGGGRGGRGGRAGRRRRGRRRGDEVVMLQARRERKGGGERTRRERESDGRERGDAIHQRRDNKTKIHHRKQDPKVSGQISSQMLSRERCFIVSLDDIIVSLDTDIDVSSSLCL